MTLTLSSTGGPGATKKDDGQYEMAIRFKKEEDFAGWYSEVSTCLRVRQIRTLADFL
jgi:hypothetical protein